MRHKQGYLLVELVMIIALNTLFITIFFTQQIRLQKEQSTVIRSFLILNDLVIAQDRLLCHQKIGERITIKEFVITKPKVESRTPVPWQKEPQRHCQLLSMGDKESHGALVLPWIKTAGKKVLA